MSGSRSRPTLVSDLRPIKIGLIHSLIGMMAVSEKPLLEAEMLAIDEINTTGGVLGCQIESVIVDGASNPETFAQKAQELLSSGVRFLFGCWTSASRKTVKPLVENADGLLWYPIQYEGLEESDHIIYTGSCPVQQIIPALEWVLANLGSRVFLLGSDYVYPRTANNLIRSEVERRKGSIVGELYVPQNGMDFASIIEEIKRQKPDVVFSTVFGESNLAFYREYHAAGIDARSIPIMSVCLSESELQLIADVAAGHYSCQNYFQSLNRPENQRFVANIKKRCGEGQVCSAPMASAYSQIYLWKLVVEATGSFDAAQVRSHVAGCEFVGPTGPIVIQQNHHTSMSAYIARATTDGQFEIIATTHVIRPLTWLGVEDSKLPYKTTVKEAMAAYPNIQNTLTELAAADKGFQEATRLNNLLLDSIPNPTVLVGTNHVVLGANRAALEIGTKIGAQCWEGLCKEKYREVCMAEQAINENETKHCETEMLGRVWDTFWVPIRKDAYLHYLVDITERKRMEEQLRESEQLHRTLAESSPDNIFIVRRDTSLQYMNRSGLEHFGLTLEEITGKKASDLFPPEVAKNVAGPISTVFQTGKPIHAENEVPFQGTVTWRDEDWIPLKTGNETTAVLGISRDITERKRMESALRERMKELNCLYGISRSIERSGSNLDAVMGEAVSIIPPAYAYPDIACARILLGNQIFESAGFKESRWSQSAAIKVLGNNAGTVEVCYLEEKPTSFEGPFSKEERALINTIAERLGRVVERKRVQDALHESEARYRDLFENSSDMIQSVNNDGMFEYVNRKWLETLGYTQEETKQLNLMDILRKDQVPHCNELFERVRNGEALDHLETVFVSKDGREILVEGNANGQFRNGQFVASRAMFRDITERKKIDLMKDQFVSMVSHELRTPLTSIRASLGLLASGLSGTLPERGQRMLEIAVTNTDRLVRLINDILDTERLASGKTPMEKKQCSVAQLVTQAADVMRPMAEKAGISLSVDNQDAALWADPDRIVQVLTNIISNAVKFSPKGGRILVTAERKNDQMLFRVQDEGRGIPPEKLGSLFERFQQVDSSDAREKGGSGLGLSISRSIIEQHNGKIWIESTVGKGSTFFFTIPLQETQVPAQPIATTGRQGTPSAVIIEDDPDLANILAVMLQRHNIQSYLAPTGEKGIVLGKEMHPDMIVLDLGLPDMDGSVVVQALREDNALRLVPLVVYTVRELDEQQRENLRLGETLFFAKSRIPPDQFEEKVVQFMKHILENRGRINVS